MQAIFKVIDGTSINILSFQIQALEINEKIGNGLAGSFYEG
jgi:hypothetical protein